MVKNDRKTVKESLQDLFHTSGITSISSSITTPYHLSLASKSSWKLGEIEYTKEQFNKSLKGVGVPNLHLGEIKKAKIIYPPLPLQQSFASKIEAIERQKSLIQQSITEAETLFNSRMDYWFS